MNAVTKTERAREPVSRRLKSRLMSIFNIQAKTTLTGTCRLVHMYLSETIINILWTQWHTVARLCCVCEIYIKSSWWLTTNKAICVAEPRATPKVISNLFLKAKMTAPACSAAFPTIGNRMMLMKLTDIPQDADASCYKLILLKFLNKEKLFAFFNILIICWTLA